MDPVDSIKVANTLGECVVWNGETQSLWWTDIQESRLYRLDWQSRALREFPTPERLCSFGFVADSTALIAAFESGFALYEPGSGRTRWLWKLARPGQRLNDGRVDRRGRFWAGAMAERGDEAGKAELFCLDANGQVQCRERGITISNSICFSPDGAVFYFADTPTRTIWRYGFSGSDGVITDRQVFAQTPDGAFPDGATVDAGGFLWSAQWGAGRVVRYTPEGAIDRVIEVPASQPTCVAFGGADLDLLFVTTAREGLSEAVLAGQTGAGDLFVYNVDVVGLPEHQFRSESLKPMGSGGL
jgi:sugar lactone lactonase YvrE